MENFDNDNEKVRDNIILKGNLYKDGNNSLVLSGTKSFRYRVIKKTFTASPYLVTARGTGYQYIYY